MSRHLFILTGGSRGMGLAMARQLLDQGRTLLCISRRDNPALTDHAARTQASLTQWTQDLADSSTLGIRLSEWLTAQSQIEWESATLINNAGGIPRIAPLSELGSADIAQAMRVGLEAPMHLTAVFLHATQTWAVPRKVLNISSGLGRRAMASQAAYCAAKAGMDHFTRCVALEEALKPNGAKVCSLAPGVIDTDMQVQLRQADAASFPDRSSFIGLQSSGQLTSPDDAAARVLNYLAREDFGAQPVGDVRD